ncbi:Arylsulfatase [Maioricimonas rarisocia]|uniref:Arylsulfatase n=1 Tax=Maioricimonas rarisocia TaxID=2528026 RepID=A0A517Z8K6_9PLAN|nr:sulfatase-like hydrolase/transferase [Maioricimonas rarisocia]QDU38818.1 Arylsulfatase [Maioricimonas rarisocia]
MRRLPLLSVLFLLAITSRVIAAEKPNFILCMTDDQGWGDVGYYGHEELKTPVLDEMAAVGLRFDRFYAAHPVCSPTRGSVMTGRNPNRFACFSWGHTLRPEEITIAETLKRAGYATGHFGKWHLGSVRAEDPVSPGHSGFDQWVSSPNFYENSPLFSKNGHVIETEGESSEVTVEAALEFIRQQKESDTPFLAVIWFGNPHTPHEAVDELQDLYSDYGKAKQNYYGELTGIDQAMGLLRTQLREMELAENTLLWFTSDNGPQGRSPGSSGGLRDAKGSLWEGGIRVPTIIEWPARIPQPRITDVPANTSDIYPTLLEIAGVTIENQPPLDGLSLVSLLDGQMESRPKPMGFWRHPTGGMPVRSREILLAMQMEQAGDGPAGEPHPRTPVSRMEEEHSPDDLQGHAAWLDGDWKLHRIPDRKNGFRYELYNLVEDAAEKTDVSDQEPERLARMKQALAEWQASVIASLNGEDY